MDQKQNKMNKRHKPEHCDHHQHNLEDNEWKIREKSSIEHWCKTTFINNSFVTTPQHTTTFYMLQKYYKFFHLSFHK